MREPNRSDSTKTTRRLEILLVSRDPGGPDALAGAPFLRQLHVAEDAGHAIPRLLGHAPFENATRPDLILLDLDHAEQASRVMTAVAAEPRCRGIAVIGMAASIPSNGKSQVAGELVDCVAKPLRAQELGDVIAAMGQDRRRLSTTKRPTGGGSEAILFVEDDTAIRTMVTRVLKTEGYRVVAAASGAEALSLWHDHPDGIDLLLTDMTLPEGRHGDHLAAELTARQPGLQVIFLSGYGPDFNRGLVLEEGVNFLNKPFSFADLLQTVRAALDRANRPR